METSQQVAVAIAVRISNRRVVYEYCQCVYFAAAIAIRAKKKKASSAANIRHPTRSVHHSNRSPRAFRETRKWPPSARQSSRTPTWARRCSRTRSTAPHRHSYASFLILYVLRSTVNLYCQHWTLLSVHVLYTSWRDISNTFHSRWRRSLTSRRTSPPTSRKSSTSAHRLLFAISLIPCNRSAKNIKNYFEIHTDVYSYILGTVLVHAQLNN